MPLAIFNSRGPAQLEALQSLLRSYASDTISYRFSIAIQEMRLSTSTPRSTGHCRSERQKRTSQPVSRVDTAPDACTLRRHTLLCLPVHNRSKHVHSDEFETRVQCFDVPWPGSNSWPKSRSCVEVMQGYGTHVAGCNHSWWYATHQRNYSEENRRWLVGGRNVLRQAGDFSCTAHEWRHGSGAIAGPITVRMHNAQVQTRLYLSVIAPSYLRHQSFTEERVTSTVQVPRCNHDESFIEASFSLHQSFIRRLP
jgi:hypothetical protein